MKLIGRNIKFLRNTRGWSQGELGKAAGISQANISKMEKGDINVSIKNVITIADIFGCSVEEIIASDLRNQDLKKVVIEYHSYDGYKIIKRPDIEVKLIPGNIYKIEPLNKSKNKNRGKTCKLIDFEGYGFDQRIANVIILENNKIENIYCDELVPLNDKP